MSSGTRYTAVSSVCHDPRVLTYVLLIYRSKIQDTKKSNNEVFESGRERESIKKTRNQKDTLPIESVEMGLTLYNIFKVRFYDMIYPN